MKVAQTCCLFWLVAFGCLVPRVQAENLELSAAELWSRARAHNVRLSDDGKTIELVRGLLIEDDGDAAGYSYQPNEESLADGTVAIKWLTIPEDVSGFDKTKAFLLVGHTGKKLQLKLNGENVELPEPEKAGNYWRRYEIPSAGLRAGKNEFRLSGDGKLWIARSDERSPSDVAKRQQQSAKLAFGSEEVLDKLGPKNDIAGEYYARLYLDGYFQEGSIWLPTMRLKNLTSQIIPPADVLVRHLRISATGEWSDKLPTIGIQYPLTRGDEVVAMTEDFVEDDRRYFFLINPYTQRPHESVPSHFEFCVRLKPHRADQSPQLKSIRISTRVDEPDPNKGKYKIVEQLNPVVGLQLFRHESLDHFRLAELRKQYNLDEVVKDCSTDLQRMEKLAIWTSRQWTKGHLGQIYPKWDALQILKKHEDGTPIGGFCQQYNIVFLQACQSFGMIGRCVSLGAGDHGVKIRSGHEVVEIWSNELNKWVYVDGQAAWYFVDKETRTPLGLLELRERQLAALLDKPLREESKRDVEVVVLATSPYEWKGLQEWPAFAELRMIPHTRFLDGRLPMPLNQGMRGWFWTGHRAWTDDLYPASVLYNKRVTNANDWNAPVNQTQIWLGQKEQVGDVEVQLAHNMPSFAEYRVQIDDQPPRDADEKSFEWSLHAGENRVEVRAVNKLGAVGPPSWMKVRYTP